MSTRRSPGRKSSGSSRTWSSGRRRTSVWACIALKISGWIERGNPYAQYALGRLYLQGREVPRDMETALRWLERSAAQGNVYAQYLLDRADEYRDPVLLLSATKLLPHMSRIL